MSGTREATHAGSWYTSSGSRLAAELSSNLAKVHSLPELEYDPPVRNAKAIIAPHAGYSYSGPAAAWAYAAISTDQVKRIFLLGPSHHAYIDGIALSGFAKYGTPVGDIPLDLDTISELRASGAFKEMRPETDEDEHSLEMHLPYIRRIFQGRDDLSLVPLLVGHPSSRTLSTMNDLLAPYFADPSTFFIISSDFCHWGTRFSCTPYYHPAPDPPRPVPPVTATQPRLQGEPEVKPELTMKLSKPAADTPIWRSIQYMDHEGMDLLRGPAEKGALKEWERYLERTKNTICGRSPISVLVSLLSHIYGEKEQKPEFVFVRYEQSSRCETLRDSSVSYVSGVLRVPE